jgi:hypothetical protein
VRRVDLRFGQVLPQVVHERKVVCPHGHGRQLLQLEEPHVGEVTDQRRTIEQAGEGERVPDADRA